MDKNFERKLNELKKGYSNKLKESYPSFKDLLDENPLNVQEIYSRVHSISGTSGMYGLNELSNLSTEFEFYLKSIKENFDSINIEELKIKLSKYLEDLNNLLNS